MKTKVQMINAIVDSYRKEHLDQGVDYRAVEADSSRFLEQLCFMYTDEQIIELYNLL